MLQDEVFIDGLDAVGSAEHHGSSELVSQHFEHIFDSLLSVYHTEEESPAQKDEVCPKSKAFEDV